MGIPKLLLTIVETWMQAHPDLVVGIIFFEIVDSLVASKLPMLAPSDPLAYKVLFVLMTGLALNPSRVGHALQQWREVEKGNDPSEQKP